MEKNVERSFLYENDVCEMMIIPASCNCCDRIVYADEMTAEQYTSNGGYCPECGEDMAEKTFFKAHPELNP